MNNNVDNIMMGLGKAQKEKRNLKTKLAKKRAEAQKQYDIIASMDNDRTYCIAKDGKLVLGGMFANGKFWKMTYGVSLE